LRFESISIPVLKLPNSLGLATAKAIRQANIHCLLRKFRSIDFLAKENTLSEKTI